MEPMEPAEKIRLSLDEARDGYEKGLQYVDVELQSRQDLYDLELEAFLAIIKGESDRDRPADHDLWVQEALLKATGVI